MENVWFKQCGTGRRFIIKVGPGADLIQVLLDFAESQELPFASTVSAVGSVRNVEIASILAGAHPQLSQGGFDAGPDQVLELFLDGGFDEDLQGGGGFRHHHQVAGLHRPRAGLASNVHGLRSS